MGEEIKRLEVRLGKIESTLAELTKALQPEGLEKAAKGDIDTYLKVLRAALAVDLGEMCGINDCYKCIAICRACKICDTGPQLCSHICYPCDTCYPCSPISPMVTSRKKGTKVFEKIG